MRAYNIGDKVRVNVPHVEFENGDYSERTCVVVDEGGATIEMSNCVVEEMEEMNGRVMTIDSVNSSGYTLEEDYMEYGFLHDWLTPIDHEIRAGAQSDTLVYDIEEVKGKQLVKKEQNNIHGQLDLFVDNLGERYESSTR